MSSALDALAPGERRLLERRPRPESPEPMKALLTEAPFSDEGWIFESTLDGVRCFAYRDAGGARPISRTGPPPHGLPELVEALERDACRDFLADGEIVAFDGEVTSFARLQGRMQIADPDGARRSGIAVFAYLFDLLHLDGHDTRALPLRARKELLRTALSFEAPVRYLTHREREGEAAFREACAAGLEGVIAKRADSRYVSGARR